MQLLSDNCLKTSNEFNNWILYNDKAARLIFMDQQCIKLNHSQCS